MTRPTRRCFLTGIRPANAQIEALRSQPQVKAFSAVKTRKAKSLLVAIINAKSPEIREGLYCKLIKKAKETVGRIESVLQKLAKQSLQGVIEYGWLCKLSSVLPLIIEQTRRRVKERTGPVDEKIFSIFEPHTDLIVKGELIMSIGTRFSLPLAPVGLLDTALVQGNPNDSEYFMDTIERQHEIYARHPRQVVDSRPKTICSMLRTWVKKMSVLPSRSVSKSRRW